MHRMTHANTIRTRLALSLYAASLVALAAPAMAQDDDAPSIAQSCLVNSEIRRTTILNDRNIVFTKRNGEIYNNYLPRQCPTLRRRSLVNYPVAGNRLCAGYRFAVIVEQRPGQFIQTALCELGAFVPISEDELADLTALTAEDRGRSTRRRSTREAVTTQPVELPPAAATPTDAAEPGAQPAASPPAPAPE
jgi:hypothetical protein